MVNEIESHINRLSDVYNDYLSFLNESLTSVNNKSELNEYLNFVEDKNQLIKTYLNSLNSENSIHLYGLIGGICRYFSEFNWFEDYAFYTKAQCFKNKLTEESYFIYNHYQTKSLAL